MAAVAIEFAYIALIFGLLVVPRVLQRFRIPAPLTCFAFGMAATLGFGIGGDETLSLLATLGISWLFLFAGLEVDVHELRRGLVALLVYLVLRSVALAAAAWLAVRWLGVPWPTALLLALALLTPSTGFILDSLARLGLDEQERFWVTTKAIGGEMLALLVLFVVLQSASVERLVWSSAALLMMLFVLPLLFIALVRYVAPYAGGSEFSLLVMVGLLAAYLTKQRVCTRHVADQVARAIEIERPGVGDFVRGRLHHQRP